MSPHPHCVSVVRRTATRAAPCTVEERWQQLCDFAHKELSEQELAIFTMRFLDGRDYKDICAETGISRIAVWKHLSHIKKLLKQQLNSKQQ